MQKTPSFTIYNASAGSGKTFTLVKEYLKILFKSSKKEPFKHVLAITFTNKAVAEMKDRIIEMLKQFSDKSILNTPNSMFKSICDELDMLPKVLHEKSKKLLNTILYNYAAFDISTIDGFTHTLIRTFAHDLKLPFNFEVELDQDTLLIEAVDSLIAKVGSDKRLTKILVDFAIEKADDDKSWDVSLDFYKISKLLVSENDIPFIETLQGKTFDDFLALKILLREYIKTAENDIIEKATSALKIIESYGLGFSDFSRSTLPNHFKKASELKLDRLYDNMLEKNISEGKVCPATLNPGKADKIDAILPQLEALFYKTKQAVFKLKFLNSFYKNSTSLSVLNALNNELSVLKTEQNKILISEFNTIISNEIKNQPTPFIYERIGEKFNHYFIDEFQDTSVLQWENLIPLLGNSLSTENGSAMLVGDAKQAIYRWRGGKAEQFIGLFNEDNPFHIKKNVRTLPTNYRSFKEIIKFNNGFFKYLAQQVFTNKDYETLYENAGQNGFLEGHGYVEFSFLNIEKEDDRDVLFSEKVLETINKCLENNFILEDICILVRKKKEGIALSNYLSQHGIQIISSETLLINNSLEVNFMNNLLTLLVQPKNNDIKVAVLNYMALKFNIENKHAFFTNHLGLPLSQLFKSFEAFNIYIKSGHLLQLPLYELAETIVRSFNLVKTSNAYIQFYLDIVLDFSHKKGSDISGFLDYFEKKKKSLSIVSTKGQDAVQIMTIHKSKGLEFPVVIFPYADLDIYRELQPKEWFELNKQKYHGFSNALLNYNKDFEYYGKEGLRIYNNHKSQQELDNINLLYVTLTRAIMQLHVISKKDISAKGIVNSKKYSGLFINYLKHIGVWNDHELSYSFGTPTLMTLDIMGTKKTPINSSPIEEAHIQQEFISTSKEDHQIKIVANSGYLWDSNRREAIEKGNLIHNLMAQIKTKADIDFVINDFINASFINLEQAKALNQTIIKIVEHPKLKDCFNSESIIYNERDIITPQGNILRPDRVVINNKKEVIILDYKTGTEDPKHSDQLQSYKHLLNEMSFKVTKKILVYVNDDIQIKEI